MAASVESAQRTVDLIIEELDKSVLLSAAYDCMSDGGKEKLKAKLKKIIEDHDS